MGFFLYFKSLAKRVWRIVVFNYSSSKIKLLKLLRRILWISHNLLGFEFGRFTYTLVQDNL